MHDLIGLSSRSPQGYSDSKATTTTTTLYNELRNHTNAYLFVFSGFLKLSGYSPKLKSVVIRMASTEMQSLLSTNKSTSGPKVALHPLVILTISDYIARHTLRNQTGPIIGALLGQQNEVTVTIEHAFEVKSGEDGSIDNVWFQNRLQQSKHPPSLFLVFTSNNH